MSYIKKGLALIMVLAMTFGLVLSANAAGSPVNPDYDPTTNTETYKHKNGAEVTTKMTSKKVEVIKVQAGDDDVHYVQLSNARNEDNNKVSISSIGDGKNGVFATKAGKLITTVKVASDEKVTLNKYAFKASKVAALRLASEEIVIKKDAFSGTKVKNLQITINGATKASDLTIKKGAFNGLNKKAKIIVKSMSDSEFKKLQKKLIAAGFKGTIKVTSK